MLEIGIVTFIMLVPLAKCDMEPFIVGGSGAKISNFPHSLFLSVICIDVRTKVAVPWHCGASILSNSIALTAGHCVSGCTKDSEMYVLAGTVDRTAKLKRGTASTVFSYLIHEKYNPYDTRCDIALLRLKTLLEFSKFVKRVAIMKDPPYFEKAQVAGWGVANERTKWTPIKLKFINQKVWQTNVCKQVISHIPRGSICASSGNDRDYAASGDSGSALMVRGYIQVGLVSFKVPGISKSLVVYTDVGYYHDWIKKYFKRLHCVPK